MMPPLPVVKLERDLASIIAATPVGRETSPASLRQRHAAFSADSEVAMRR